MKIISKLTDGQLIETKHPLECELTIIHKRIGDKVFVTCFNSKREEVASARFTTYEEWKQNQLDYYHMCRDSDRHIGDGLFDTELL